MADENGRPALEGDTAAAVSPALERLRRWEAAGGGWHVVRIGAAGATVLLERCDLGEAVDSISSSDPAFLAHLQAHPGSDG
jgi:limonene-1,2-epoxide hydrolase